MVAKEIESLVDLLALAYLRALPHDQVMLLHEVAEGAQPSSRQKLSVLQDLFETTRNGRLGLPEQAQAELRGLLQRLTESQQANDRWEHLESNPFIAITKGAATAIRMTSTVPETLVTDRLKVGLFKTVEALKSGDLAKADALMMVLSENFDIPKLEDCGPDYEPELSGVLFMKAIYSDEEITEQAIERLFETLSTLPKDASLLRAVLYNVLLDVFLRQQRLSEAEEAAHRALFHYNAAGEKGVAFYVHLYLVVVGLWRGNLEAAKDQLDEASRALCAFEGSTSNDDLLLGSFEMIVAYEDGDDESFIKHLLGNEDTIPFGELWPSVAGPIISYGRCALANKVTPAAALSWVRRWRVRQRRSLRFDKLISVQEALALQDLGRWQEADEVLGEVATSKGSEVQIARFASGLDRNAKSNALASEIVEHLTRPNLSVRQKHVLRLMATESALARGIEREAARHLSAAIKECDPSVFPSVWSEQRQRVALVLGKRQLRTELKRFPKLKRQIQALANVETPEKPSELTRQEYRILQLLAEAQSNKAIGARLGISLPTVKFHVANLCRKTQSDNRRAAVRSAVDLGWLSADAPNTYT